MHDLGQAPEVHPSVVPQDNPTLVVGTRLVIKGFKRAASSLDRTFTLEFIMVSSLYAEGSGSQFILKVDGLEHLFNSKPDTCLHAINTWMTRNELNFNTANQGILT